MSTDLSNIHFQLALRYVKHSNRHIFLTGRAGTGKTTFLRHIRSLDFKKMAIVAPTGVAAINAGGVTIHSFFQIAPGIFQPVYDQGWGESGQRILNKTTLIKSLRIQRQKKDLLRELELLVIDEVSMVRADLLDAMDTVLRFVKKRPDLPFGGIQVLFIGDLHQLPPVVNNEDWEYLRQHYSSPFFFDAQVLRQFPPLYLELKKIYRQKDDQFISLLNVIRNNQVTKQDLDLLKQHYNPDFTIPAGESWITLTTHNTRAEIINESSLKALSGRIFISEAEIKGDFPEKSYPAEVRLCLKEGAQVMFIKNDSGETRRYYNGKIGTVTRISPDNKVYVRFENENGDFEVSRETWQNIRYKFDQEKDIIDEEEMGSFSQLPIRLAWAITIHKSQGLTFEKAVIDAGQSFTAGQVYVALSRMTSLKHMVLLSRIEPHCIMTDNRVVAFSKSRTSDDVLHEELYQEQLSFIAASLAKGFSLQKIRTAFEELNDFFEEGGLIENTPDIEWPVNALESVRKEYEIAARFGSQLRQLFLSGSGDNVRIQERTIAAKNYFAPVLKSWKNELVKNRIRFLPDKNLKKFIPEIDNLILEISRKEIQISKAVELTSSMKANSSHEELVELAEKLLQPVFIRAEHSEPIRKEKKKTAKTSKISFDLFRAGKSIPDIAIMRNLTVNTIENHLQEYLKTGEIEITDLVSIEKLDLIIRAFDDSETFQLKPVKDKLGDNFSYGEIRSVLIYLRKEGMIEKES